MFILVFGEKTTFTSYPTDNQLLIPMNEGMIIFPIICLRFLMV